MTINEAITQIQKRKVRGMNKFSVNYAETLIEPDEKVVTAVVANIRTKRENYPGIVAITDKRILAACGLPGIKRSLSLPLDEIENCEEASSVIQYKATFYTRREAIGLSVDPDVGEAFSAYVAQLNGEEMESSKVKVTGNIINPTILEQKKKNKKFKEASKARSISNDINLQKKAADQFDSFDDEQSE